MTIKLHSAAGNLCSHADWYAEQTNNTNRESVHYSTKHLPLELDNMVAKCPYSHHTHVQEGA